MRFHCQQLPHANAWLSVLPSVQKRQLMATVEFRCLLRWTLGTPMLSHSSGLACPRCSAPMSPSGHHFVCCHLNNITGRHFVMVDALAQLASKAGFPCKKEQGLPDNGSPGDLFISRLDVDGPGAIYFTVRDPLQPSHPATPVSIAAGTRPKKNRRARSMPPPVPA